MKAEVKDDLLRAYESSLRDAQAAYEQAKGEAAFNLKAAMVGALSTAPEEEEDEEEAAARERMDELVRKGRSAASGAKRTRLDGDRDEEPEKTLPEKQQALAAELKSKHPTLFQALVTKGGIAHFGAFIKSVEVPTDLITPALENIAMRLQAALMVTFAG